MLTVDEALRLVQAQAKSLPPRQTQLCEAAGLILAQNVASDIDSPPHDKTLMDGYAVVSSDQTEVRHVVEEIAAGDVPKSTVAAGIAARIMTGAPLPAGADAIVPIEETELLENNRVQIRRVANSPGQHVLRRGASIRVGDVVVQRGAMLRPIEIAILAEAGCANVCAVPRPRVAVLSTGNELVPVEIQPGPGQIRNSNSPLLLAAASNAGATAVDLGVARDNRDDLVSHIKLGLEADALVLSGGVSAGKFDLVPQVLADLGVRQVFHKISLRPGKPLWFGVRENGEHRTLVFGLPGNPVSSCVCFELFVRPAITLLSGRSFLGLPFIQANLAHDYRSKGGREAFVPARISWPANSPPPNSTIGEQPTIEILPWQGSADLATLARANGLAHLIAEPAELQAGDSLKALAL